MSDEVLKILLADDNDANRLISRTILERAGYSVTVAENGAHALTLASLEARDLIVLDILMPVMDGVRALRQLRRLKGPNQKTPVFALTAFSTTQDRQRYLLAGFDTVLSKPLRPGDMEAAINQYIQGGAKPNPYLTVSAKPEKISFSNDLNILNDEIVRELCEVGDTDMLKTVQMRYWASVEEQCLIINQSLPEALRGAATDLSQFRRAVHAIKGASATIGLARIAEICRRLQNTPPRNIPTLVSTLLDAISQSRPVLAQALSGPGELDPAVEVGRQDEPKAAHHG